MVNVCRCGKPYSDHATETMIKEFSAQTDHLIRERSGGELNLTELARCVPPRMPTGCWQNYRRRTFVHRLNRAGFTFLGKRL